MQAGRRAAPPCCACAQPRPAAAFAGCVLEPQQLCSWCTPPPAVRLPGGERSPGLMLTVLREREQPGTSMTTLSKRWQWSSTCCSCLFVILHGKVAARGWRKLLARHQSHADAFCPATVNFHPFTLTGHRSQGVAAAWRAHTRSQSIAVGSVQKGGTEQGGVHFRPSGWVHRKTARAAGGKNGGSAGVSLPVAKEGGQAPQPPGRCLYATHVPNNQPIPTWGHCWVPPPTLTVQLELACVGGLSREHHRRLPR